MTEDSGRTEGKGLPRTRKKILFLFSDTGGGHRSAAEAIVEALEERFPGAFACELVDVFREYAPRPLDRMPDLYPSMTRVPAAWGVGYRVSNGRRRVRALERTLWPYVRRAARRLVAERHPDLYVSVHPLLNHPVLRALGSERPPFMTVVTDLVTAHSFWYAPGVDECLVPTEAARERALQTGLEADRVHVVGLPVSRAYCGPDVDPAEARRKLGWPLEVPMVLLVGGGEGMGPLFPTARALARSGASLGLAVVAGRNQALREHLEAVAWEVPTHIYGFERRLPLMMQAASILVTKAGPGTMTEAMNAGLPMVLYSRLPGQEEGNVTFAETQGVGIWAPGPRRTVEAVAGLLSDEARLSQMQQRCRQISKPEAARLIAERIARRVGVQVASEP